MGHALRLEPVRCPHARGGVPSTQRRSKPSLRLSPRTWGCTDRKRTEPPTHKVVPTHVGVYRRSRDRSRRPDRCPHARGGVPRETRNASGATPLSPRTWGCTADSPVRRRTVHVVPTHVGVYRPSSRPRPRSGRCPHARGGVPMFRHAHHQLLQLSPRTWGCTAAVRCLAEKERVVPTHVGVYRWLSTVLSSRGSCPHARGGVPQWSRWFGPAAALSPRTWGCTESILVIYGFGFVVPTHVGVYLEPQPGEWRCSVVPTHVGVYRIGASQRRWVERCPHARGGVPRSRSPARMWNALSPRTWGCTGCRTRSPVDRPVVPTHVGVYRRPLRPECPGGRCPHARGGVPERETAGLRAMRLSPRTWGCTTRRSGRSGWHRWRCPHARGGVPIAAALGVDPSELSPRTWGCTGRRHRHESTTHVVPTHVGVYRLLPASVSRADSCPHARGGVPPARTRAFTNASLSPRTWGCTVAGDHGVDVVHVVPTHVGVYRSPPCPSLRRARCPHARGGVPGGCQPPAVATRVVPTHVGVYRPRPGEPVARPCCPHARGGVPSVGLPGGLSVKLSPRTWGCTDVLQTDEPRS